ncbi:purple acid phosphatase 4 isoform X1 [Manihot esculenta]|uniref:purple acid phosphatase 4 isoform X1 n=1 Tax=Manihot esculenta TaxID=3983 RepID=UPI001CC7F4F1|nr:purple acid phosphatase 4 isoform X1 [Manihot esculenta]
MSELMVSSLMLSALLGFSIINLCAAELQRFQNAAKGDGSLSLLVVGDWGRKGAYNQSHVALQMGIIGEKSDIDFVISTGDNFYENGLTGVDDPAFYESFTKIYTARSLQKQWYSVLGNHDYRGDVEAQLSPALRQIDSKWLCLRSFIVDTEIADFFFVDTTPFVDKYFKDKDHEYDWSGIVPRKSYLSNLLKDLDKSLKESKAKWKIVVGHHTIKSAGNHGNTQELNKQLLPILVVGLLIKFDLFLKKKMNPYNHNYYPLIIIDLQENNVDLYINGHDHCLEHISSSESELQFLTSGGGSRAWIGDIDWWNPKEMKFYYDGQGFMSVEITETQVDVMFYDVSGHILHKWSRNKQPYSIV